jgi:hypothetical protein
MYIKDGGCEDVKLGLPGTGYETLVNMVMNLLYP